MKNFTLSILALATVIGIVPTMVYPVDVTKDGITIRVNNEQDKSEMLKSNGLACLYVRIKNDTGAQVDMPKYAVSSPLIANEKVLTEAMGSTPKEVGKFIARFVTGTGLQLIPSLAAFLFIDHIYDRTPFIRFVGYLTIAGCGTSPIAGAAWAVKSYLHQAQVPTILQEYLDRKATTIQINGEHGFYIYIDLDQYHRSIGKNITIRLHKKDTDQPILFEIDTTGLLQTQAA